MDDFSIATFLGQLAGLISFAAYFFYIVAILRGTTKPNRATWWILTLVGAMIAVSYYASGARNTIWIPISYVLGPLIVAILSLKYGENYDGKIFSRLDKTCLVGTVISFFIWILLNSPFAALLINIFIDFLGLIPTVKKSFLRPWTEDRFAWILTFFSSMLNVFALESWDIELSLYIIYMLLVNGLVVLFLFRPLVNKKITP